MAPKEIYHNVKYGPWDSTIYLDNMYVRRSVNRFTVINGEHYDNIVYIHLDSETEQWCCDLVFGGVFGGFDTPEEAMKMVDEMLIANGCTFLSQEEWDKYQVLA